MKRLVPAALTLALFANLGCHMFSKSKNPAAPKESSTVAADDERDFMNRWLDKRTADLVTAGTPTGAARAQAVAEFKEKYSYLASAKNAK
jgi:hypothetical protein